MRPASAILIKNACVITGGGVNYPNGYVYINDGVIVAVGPMSGLRKIVGAKIIDAKGSYCLPAFTNPHTHFYGALSRGMRVARMPKFGDVLKNLWWRLDQKLSIDDIFISTQVCAIEAIKNGVTTIFDHHASYGAIKDSLGTIARALKPFGIRASLCYEISDRNGKKARAEAIKESGDWLAHVGGCLERDREYPFRGMVGLHASMTLSDDTLKIARELADAYDVGCHVHVAEGREDLNIIGGLFGKTPVSRFVKSGVLNERSLAAHCVHVTGDDIKLLRTCKTTVIHNPMSNLNNAVGISPVVALQKLHVPVAIGTDGMSAGVFDDIKLAAFLHKLGTNDAQMGMNTESAVWGVAARLSSRIFEKDIGVIRKGAAADVIIADSKPPTEVNDANGWWHVLFGVMNSPIRTVFANGRMVMQDFELLGIKEEEIAKEARVLAKKMWKKT